MPFAYSLKRTVLAGFLGTAFVLAGTPSFAYAMVGDVPSMPAVEHHDPLPGNGIGGPPDMGGGGSSGSGLPPATPEPTTLVSGLLGFGLMGAYVVVCRGSALGERGV
jgi:hypothetical protein